MKTLNVTKINSHTIKSIWGYDRASLNIEEGECYKHTSEVYSDEKITIYQVDIDNFIKNLVVKIENGKLDLTATNENFLNSKKIADENQKIREENEKIENEKYQFELDKKNIEEAAHAEWVKLQNEQDRIRRELEEIKNREIAALWEYETKKFVMENCNENQKKRFAESFLPETEIETEMKKIVFEKLSQFPKYQNITRDDIDHDEYCSGKMEFKIEESEELTSYEFDFMEKIREIWGNKNEIACNTHTAYCTCDEDNTVEKKSVDITTQKYGRELTLKLQM